MDKILQELNKLDLKTELNQSQQFYVDKLLARLSDLIGDKELKYFVEKKELKRLDKIKNTIEAIYKILKDKDPIIRLDNILELIEDSAFEIYQTNKDDTPNHIKMLMSHLSRKEVIRLVREKADFSRKELEVLIEADESGYPKRVDYAADANPDNPRKMLRDLILLKWTKVNPNSMEDDDAMILAKVNLVVSESGELKVLINKFAVPRRAEFGSDGTCRNCEINRQYGCWKCAYRTAVDGELGEDF